MDFDFDPHQLHPLAAKHRFKFQEAKPFPHAVLDDFLPQDFADELLRQFPEPGHPCFFKNRELQLTQPNKVDMGVPDIGRLARLPKVIRQGLQAFNSAPFLDFLERLTGIPNLIPDPYFLGGGVHQILPGGHLVAHEDFNYHPKLKLFRRINVLLYLNKAWQESYKGNLQFWPRDMADAPKKVAPLFNRLVAFNIYKATHGHPEPLNCPHTMTRKSLALYYYTTDPQIKNQEKTAMSYIRRSLPPASFFNTVLPQQIEEKRASFAAMGCILHFYLKGANGGNWTVDLTSAQPKVDKQVLGEASCSLHMSDEDFWRLITRELDFRDAKFGEAARIEGDPSIMKTFFGAVYASPLPPVAAIRI